MTLRQLGIDLSAPRGRSTVGHFQYKRKKQTIVIFSTKHGILRLFLTLRDWQQFIAFLRGIKPKGKIPMTQWRPIFGYNFNNDRTDYDDSFQDHKSPENLRLLELFGQTKEYKRIFYPGPGGFQELKRCMRSGVRAWVGLTLAGGYVSLKRADFLHLRTLCLRNARWCRMDPRLPLHKHLRH
jgi:hypothetical protein